MSESNSTVVYRQLPEYPGYRIGEDGTVWTCWIKNIHPAVGQRGLRGTFYTLGNDWKKMRLGLHPKTKYQTIVLRGKKTRLAHSLVLQAFTGPCPPKLEACHNDGNRSNNAAANLRWDTKSSNQADRITHGTDNSGERNPWAKLTDDVVRALRREYVPRKVTFQKLADKYGITKGNVIHVIKRHTWKHVA